MKPAGLGPLAATRRGVIAHFDEGAGLGTVREADGTERAFHCSVIIDGSRSIAAGTPVFYRLRAATLGRIEATEISTAAMFARSEPLRDEPATRSPV